VTASNETKLKKEQSELSNYTPIPTNKDKTKPNHHEQFESEQPKNTYLRIQPENNKDDNDKVDSDQSNSRYIRVDSDHNNKIDSQQKLNNYIRVDSDQSKNTDPVDGEIK